MLLSFGIVWAVGLLSSASADDARLLRSVDTLVVVPPSAAAPPLKQLQRELANLWDWSGQKTNPLTAQVVFSMITNGVKVEGIYVNGLRNERGQDRIFFYFARPLNSPEKLPAYLELTGGGEPDKSIWLARSHHCAVADIEWRGPQNRFRSQWASGALDSIKELGHLRDNAAFHLVSGMRRVLDFLEKQPEIDCGRIGCGGGSMGGYYTLLLAGVDSRISFGMDELGAGHLAKTGSRLGEFKLDAGRKQIWIQAFDPETYAAQTRAKIFLNLSANDYFFWLGDALANASQLAGENRFCIHANFNHNDGPVGGERPIALAWLEYAFGRTPAYPQVLVVSNATGSCEFSTTNSPDTAITNAFVCWSPGETVVWPARYWLRTPARRVTGGQSAWHAEIPALDAALARVVFVTVEDRLGRAVSSAPVFVPGIEPQQATNALLPGNQLWDCAAGVSAWRLVGPNSRAGADRVRLQMDGEDGIAVAPAPGGRKEFSLVSNSLILSAGNAVRHRGIGLVVDGNGGSGKLRLSLVQNFGSAQTQKEWSTKLAFSSQPQIFQIPWSQFFGPETGSFKMPRFESLRLDGTCTEGQTVKIRGLRFLD